MGTQGIPDEVEAFIREHIHSIEQLEVLLLLKRSPNEVWSAELVARELRIDAESAARRIEDLVGRGLIGSASFTDRYCYAPKSPELDRCVEGLTRAYGDRRVSVIALIFTKPDPAQSFADAFRVRESKK